MADSRSQNPIAPVTPKRAHSPPTGDRPKDGISQHTRTRIAYSSTKSTPRSKDIGTDHDYHSGPAPTADDIARNTLAYNRWKELHKAFDYPRNHAPAGSIEEFVRIFVPSDVDIPVCDAQLQRTLLECAADIIAPKGKEKVSYEGIIHLLEACQIGLDDMRKILFFNTASVRMDGPTHSDHWTGPDILGSYPGMPRPTEDTWDKYSVPIEVKTERDPVELLEEGGELSEYIRETIAQIVKNARNLLFFSSGCYVFAIGIYTGTHKMRIYRFDHSGSVSCGFNYIEKPHIIREFLWKLVHPRHGIPNTVVGWDETIRIPSKADMKKMQKVVKKFNYENQLDERLCRWIRVRLDCASFRAQMGLAELPSASSGSEAEYYDLEGFTFGKPLHKASGLFSRASYVSRIALKVPGEGRNRYYQFVLKDSWHQAVREPEASYYQTVQERFKRLKEEDGNKFAWIQELIPDCNLNTGKVPGLAEYYGHLDLSTYDLLPGSNEQHGIQPSLQSNDGATSSTFSPSDDRGHSTVTSRLQNGKIASEKTRGRALMGPIGRSLTKFNSTRDVVVAIRDAIVGHFIAMSCGVLHRDISIGNILMAERDGVLEGFLHDFDFASFISEDPENLIDSEQILKDLKRMTGTHQFMAIDVLSEQTHKPHHDLESFYWVLIWVLLRHTDYQAVRGDQACTKLFDYADSDLAKIVKHSWITQADEPLTIKRNPPLSALLKQLRRIFYKSHRRRPKIPTHKKVLSALQAQINAPGWPVKDLPFHFTHPERKDEVINTTYSNSIRASSGSRHSSRLAFRSTLASNTPHIEEAQREESLPRVAAPDVPMPDEDLCSLSASSSSSSNSQSDVSLSSSLPKFALRRPNPPDGKSWTHKPRPEPPSSQASTSMKRSREFTEAGEVANADDAPRKKSRASASSASEKV